VIAGGNVVGFTFQCSDDGTQATCLADQDGDESELYRVDIVNPGISARLNGALVSGGEVWDFSVTK
jgi:hypothetical protein